MSEDHARSGLAAQQIARTVAVTEKRRLRIEAADEIERLLSMLDALDDDPDLEEEPDAEIECEDEGAQCEDEGSHDDQEPELGWRERDAQGPAHWPEASADW